MAKKKNNQRVMRTFDITSTAVTQVAVELVSGRGDQPLESGTAFVVFKSGDIYEYSNAPTAEIFRLAQANVKSGASFGSPFLKLDLKGGNCGRAVSLTRYLMRKKFTVMTGPLGAIAARAAWSPSEVAVVSDFATRRVASAQWFI